MHAQHIDFLDLLDGQVQYIVPRWQRRYRWGQADIERLVEDLLTVAMAGPEAAHYGGTLLTFPEPGPAGVVKTIRVVDGQQRLTTVSILLACIAEALGADGQYGDWTAQIIREDRLTNRGKAPEKHRKLRLQHGDDDEYRLGLEGKTVGAGAVSQAWRIARRLVARNDVTQLFEGLKRLRVVSIGLEQKEDPQQIFESLNATGRPLTESEKVKNWLLMGLPDAEQQDLHDNLLASRSSAQARRRAHDRTHRHLPSGPPSLADGRDAWHRSCVRGLAKVGGAAGPGHRPANAVSRSRAACWALRDHHRARRNPTAIGRWSANFGICGHWELTFIGP